MPKPEKEAVVATLAEKIATARSIFLTDFTGLDVETINQLRWNFKSSGVEFRVVKNTLTKLALERAGCPELSEYLEGPTALAFGYDDPIVPVKILVKFHDEHGKPRIKSCFVEGKVFPPDLAVSLAKLPDREVLLAQVVAGVQAPLVRLLMVLQGVLNSLVWTLQALLERRQQEGS